MRRKYDARNKRNFIIILVIAVIIIAIFSLFVYKYKQAGKIAYLVKTGCVVQDNKKNFIDVNEDATLKIRWNGNYYLIYQDKKIDLGKKVIVFDTIDGSMKLYGKFHEIQEDGKIVENVDETVLSNTTNNKFYKLDDREYLLVDREITSEDKSINASNYLLVELDRMGNAKLSNNKLNLKTINPTVLTTSKYNFDIANELLKFKELEIDLKKIIGTTNQYKPEESEKKDDDSGSGGGTGEGGNNNTVIANPNGNAATVIDNNQDKGEEITIDKIIEKTKTTSIVGVIESFTQVDINYAVFDPYNEYKSLYAKIIRNGVEETIPMDKKSTQISIGNLVANKAYTISFYYTTIDKESLETVPTKFEEITVKTKKPEYSVSVYKISGINKKIYYKVYLQSGYHVDSVDVSLIFKYRDVDDDGNGTIKTKTITKTLLVGDGVTVLKDEDGFSIDGYDIVSSELAKIIIDSVTSNGEKITVNNYTAFRIGG